MFNIIKFKKIIAVRIRLRLKLVWFYNWNVLIEMNFVIEINLNETVFF